MKEELGLAGRFVADHPEQAAEVLEQLSFADAAAVLARVSASLAVDRLRPLPESAAGEILGGLPLESALQMLRRAPEDVREAWLRAMPAERAELLRRKLRYPPGTAGALADPLVLALTVSSGVAGLSPPAPCIRCVAAEGFQKGHGIARGSLRLHSAAKTLLGP